MAALGPGQNYAFEHYYILQRKYFILVVFGLLQLVASCASLESRTSDKLNISPLLEKAVKLYKTGAEGHEDTKTVLRDLLTAVKLFEQKKEQEGHPDPVLDPLPKRIEAEARAKGIPLDPLFYQLLLSAAKDVFGPMSHHTIDILTGLGHTLILQGNDWNKTLEVYLVLEQLHLHILESSKGGDEKQVQNFLAALNDIAVIYFKQENWDKAEEALKRQYEIQARLRLSSPSFPLRRAFQNLAGRLERIHSGRMGKQIRQMFQLVEHSWGMKQRIGPEDLDKHVLAYEQAYKLTMNRQASEAFGVYKELWKLKTEREDEEDGGRLIFDELEIDPNPPKFDVEVLEVLFTIHRLITSSPHLVDDDPVMQKYKEMANNCDLQDGIPEINSALERKLRAMIRRNQADGLDRVKDILRRRVDKFGKGSEQTRSAAQIFATLFTTIEMDNEAADLQRRFGVQLQTVDAAVRNINRNNISRDEL